MKVFNSRKAVEMTIPVIIAIVLGLIIVAILFFALRGKTKSLSEAGGCPENECALPNENCDSLMHAANYPEENTYVKSFTSCKKGDASGKCCRQSIV